jgi:hypothetical protein
MPPVDQNQQFENINNPLNIPGPGLTIREEPLEPIKQNPKTKLKLTAAIIGLTLIVLVVGNAFTGNKVVEETQTLIGLKPNEDQSKNTQNSPTPIDNTKEKPELNTLYLGTYNNSTVMFRTDEEYLEIGKVPAQNGFQPYFGEATVPGGQKITKVLFSTVEQPIKVFFNEDVQIKSIDGFHISSNDPDTVYLLISSEGSSVKYINLTQRIFKINKQNGQSRLVLLHEVGSNKYDRAYGPLKIEQEWAPDHLLLSVAKDLTGNDTDPVGYVIINSLSRAEDYRTRGGDFQYHPDSKEYTYRNLIPFSSGVWRPIGQEFRYPLP